MKPTNRRPTHPGEILWEEFLLTHPMIDGDLDKLFEYLTVVYACTPGFWKSLYDNNADWTKED